MRGTVTSLAHASAYQCNSLAEWNQHVSAALEIIEPAETEDNWNRMERSFLLLASVVRGGAYKFEADFVPGVRLLARPTTKAVSVLHRNATFQIYLW